MSRFVTAPVSVFVTLFTIRGCINTPSFAIEDTAVIIWSGVIVNLWPNEIVASSTGPTESLSWKIPVASPDVAIPVFVNSPKDLKYLYKVSTPIFCPSCMNAGLHEFSNAWRNDWYPCPASLAQRIFLSATSCEPEQKKIPGVSVETIFSSNAAEATTTLKTEPGSYVFETAVFLHIFCNASLWAVFDNESHVLESEEFGSNGVFKL